MAHNDTVNVTFVPFEGQDDVIEWSLATAVVEAIETLVNGVALELIRQRHFATVDEIAKLPRASAMLAASPRRGSILVQLVFSVPDLAHALTSELQPGLIDGNIFNKKLASLADAVTLFEFARRMIFDDWGMLAQRTGALAQREPFKADEEVAYYVAAENTLPTLEPVIVRLMEAAKKTHCESVQVQSGDGASISITRSPPRAHRNRLGRARSTSQQSQLAGVFTRTDDDAVRVDLGGRTYDCIAATAEANTIPLLFLWGSSQSLPAPRAAFEVQATPVARDDLIPADEIPDTWTEATGVWLAERAKPFIDFS